MRRKVAGRGSAEPSLPERRRKRRRGRSLVTIDGPSCVSSFAPGAALHHDRRAHRHRRLPAYVRPRRFLAAGMLRRRFRGDGHAGVGDKRGRGRLHAVPTNFLSVASATSLTATESLSNCCCHHHHQMLSVHAGARSWSPWQPGCLLTRRQQSGRCVVAVAICLRACGL